MERIIIQKNDHTKNKQSLSRYYSLIVFSVLLSSFSSCFEKTPHHKEVHMHRTIIAQASIRHILEAEENYIKEFPNTGYVDIEELCQYMKNKGNSLFNIINIDNDIYLSREGYMFKIYLGFIEETRSKSIGKVNHHNFLIIYAWPETRYTATMYYIANSFGDISAACLVNNWKPPQKWDYKIVDVNKNNTLDAYDNISWTK